MKARTKRLGMLLILVAAVGIGAFLLSFTLSTHAVQTKASASAQSAPANTAASTAAKTGPYANRTLPPSIISSIPCQKCAWAHIGFWS